MCVQIQSVKCLEPITNSYLVQWRLTLNLIGRTTVRSPATAIERELEPFDVRTEPGPDSTGGKKKCLEPIRNMGSCFFTKTIIWICIYYFLLKIFAVFMWGLHGVLNSVYSNCFLGLNISILTIINKKMAQCWVCFLSLPQEC